MINDERVSLPKLYHELASWWPLLSAPGDYAEEAGIYQHALVDACAAPPKSLLELGSGGGNNASHLKARFDMTLVDRSSETIPSLRRSCLRTSSCLLRFRW